ncbi:RDD family protein [Clostridium liquoris]|uniref:RDD family protein n=1 Tax=Clostridium liquoris TaxID=1289519 RepID=A0A2T0B2G6_9CLOT|nr:RDD family protein [Clostridium liquoris]PRR78056.1 RDD family protein [Clostridium liquoris]
MSEENHEIKNEEVENNIAKENLKAAGENSDSIEEAHKKETKGVSFKNSFMAILIDTIVVTGISLVGLLIFNRVILKLLGLKIVSEYKGSVLLIIFIIVSMLYTSIMESKNGNTIGKKYRDLRVEKIEK